MKKTFEKCSSSGLFLFAIMLACTLFGITGVDAVFANAPAAAVAAAAVAAGEPGGEGGIAGEGFVTLEQALTDSPTMVLRAIHDQVIKIAPYDYVTRSLLAQNFKIKKKTKDHKVVVYSAESSPISMAVATAYTQSAVEQAEVNFGAQNKLFAVNETVYFPDITGYQADGTTSDSHCLVCYVVAKGTTTGAPVLKPRNGKSVSGTITIPSLALNTRALRGLRTGTETQIRTEPVNILPTPGDYFIQKNIIEFGVSGWFNNATKEVKWDDRDMMEMAVAEKIRTSMPDFWLGVSGSGLFNTKYNDDKDELAYFHEGVWTQAGREFNFHGVIDIDAIIDFGKYVFTGNRSSNEKYFVMGSTLSAEFQKVIFANPTLLGETYRDKELNINFTAVNFFGGKKILFADDPSLDDIGMGNCGFLLDHKYAFEYNYGIMSIPIDNKKMQKADSTGQAIVEENCFILANKESHCRVIF